MTESDDSEESVELTESEEVYAFFHQVGVAMSQWANVELQLEIVSGLCSREGRIGFRAIENFRSKAAYVDALVRHKYLKSAGTVDAWERLYRDVMTASGKRNDLAHRTPMRVMGGKPGSRIALFKMAFHEKDRKGIAIKEVAQQALEFRHLYLRLDQFGDSLSPRKGKPPASLSQPVRRLTLKDIEAQMREAFGRQPRPSGALPEQKKEPS